jgi:RsmE family RNA methyltransferase
LITQDQIALKRYIQKDILRTGSTHKLQLFQALPNKIEKMELILQKCAEIGVTDFHFFPSERSQVSSIVSGEKKNKYAHLGREKT